MAISGHQWPSVAISGHRWPSVAISGHQWPSVAISGNQTALKRRLAQGLVDHSGIDALFPSSLMREAISRNQWASSPRLGRSFHRAGSGARPPSPVPPPHLPQRDWHSARGRAVMSTCMPGRSSVAINVPAAASSAFRPWLRCFACDRRRRSASRATSSACSA